MGLRNPNFWCMHRKKGIVSCYERAIYNELVARGANVDVGVIEIQESVDGKRVKKQLEIDFIVNLGTRKIYIQSAYQMPTREKLCQEVRGLKRIKDFFRKIVVVGDPQPMYTDESGITHVGLAPLDAIFGACYTCTEMSIRAHNSGGANLLVIAQREAVTRLAHASRQIFYTQINSIKERSTP